jgi:hypothetical protein
MTLAGSTLVAAPLRRRAEPSAADIDVPSWTHAFGAASGGEQRHFLYVGGSIEEPPLILTHFGCVLSSTTFFEGGKAAAAVHVGLWPMHSVSLETSTAPELNSDVLGSEPMSRELRAILRASEDESFEDGFESTLSQNITHLVEQHGDGAIAGIANCFSGLRSSVAGEVLRALGRMQDTRTHNSRYLLLVAALKHRSPSVRDSAALGLGSLGDSRAIDELALAVEREPLAELRTELVKLIHSLTG